MKHLDENFETKSKSGHGSYRSGTSATSSQGGGYNSRRMKEDQKYKGEEAKYHDKILEAVKIIKFT